MEEISKINKKINQSAPPMAGGFGGGPPPQAAQTPLDTTPSGPLADSGGVFQPKQGGGFKWTRVT